MFEAVRLGLKQRVHVRSSGVGLEMAGSRSKQWSRVGNGGLMFQAVRSGSKQWARVPSSGVRLETAGSRLKQWGWA